MANNRTPGVVHLTVGILWLAVLPVFLWFMVSMEAGADPLRSDRPAYRLWRALEVLLVEPRWLGNTLSALLLAASVLGGALVGTGTGMLRGTAQDQKWPTLAAVSGILFCAIGFAFHWALLMPVVNASQNPEVLQASEDLNRAIPVALGAGLVSMIVATLVLLGARRQAGSPGNNPARV
jgi:hypothetical protein